eukprot:308996-Chlamydomonas_euryale.AAC.3
MKQLQAVEGLPVLDIVRLWHCSHARAHKRDCICPEKCGVVCGLILRAADMECVFSVDLWYASTPVVGGASAKVVFFAFHSTGRLWYQAAQCDTLYRFSAYLVLVSRSPDGAARAFLLVCRGECLRVRSARRSPALWKAAHTGCYPSAAEIQFTVALWKAARTGCYPSAAEIQFTVAGMEVPGSDKGFAAVPAVKFLLHLKPSNIGRRMCSWW